MAMARADELISVEAEQQTQRVPAGGTGGLVVRALVLLEEYEETCLACLLVYLSCIVRGGCRPRPQSASQSICFC